jgi:hypothetical protein
MKSQGFDVTMISSDGPEVESLVKTGRMHSYTGNAYTKNQSGY